MVGYVKKGASLSIRSLNTLSKILASDDFLGHLIKVSESVAGSLTISPTTFLRFSNEETNEETLLKNVMHANFFVRRTGVVNLNLPANFLYHYALYARGEGIISNRIDRNLKIKDNKTIPFSGGEGYIDCVSIRIRVINQQAQFIQRSGFPFGALGLFTFYEYPQSRLRKLFMKLMETIVRPTF
jgi:hypothetical protein